MEGEREIEGYSPLIEKMELLTSLAIIVVFAMYLVAVGFFASALFKHLHINEKKFEVRCEVKQPYWY